MIEKSKIEDVARQLLELLESRSDGLRFVVVLARKEEVGTTFAVVSDLNDQSAISLLSAAIDGLKGETASNAGDG